MNETSKIAFITGITGQDGAYLADLLLNRGYEVHGLKRRASTDNLQRLQAVCAAGYPRIILHDGDVTDTACMANLLRNIQPDEVYNLAAQSHVKTSFEMPEYTGNVDALGSVRLLEALRITGLTEKTRFYQASTSELFGNSVAVVSQAESTPFLPRSPYAAAKLYAYWVTVNYREAYGMFACNGILFNHESPWRGEMFLTRKITLAAAQILMGTRDSVLVGNLDARRDWGHARDYVDGMWRMLQHEKPDDFVLATGKTHTVRYWIELAMLAVGIPIVWCGSGLEEKGYDRRNGKMIVEVDPVFFRPTEVDYLCGDPAKAKKYLGWSAQTSMEQLVTEMVEMDVARLERRFA